MVTNRDHHGVVGGDDPFDKAERDLAGVFSLARRVQRAWHELMSPDREPEPPRRPSRAPARQRPQQTVVDAQVVEDSPSGVKIVVRQEDRPIKPGRP